MNERRTANVQLNVRITPEMSALLETYCAAHGADGKPMRVQHLVMQALTDYMARTQQPTA